MSNHSKWLVILWYNQKHVKVNDYKKIVSNFFTIIYKCYVLNVKKGILI